MSQRRLLQHILCLVAVTGIWATTDKCDEGSGEAATTNVTASVACSMTSTLYPYSTASVFTMTDLPSSSLSLVTSAEVSSQILSTSSITSKSDFQSSSIQPFLTTSELLMPTILPSSTILTMTQSLSLMATTSTVLFITTTQSSLTMGTTNQLLLPSSSQTLAISTFSSVIAVPSSPSPATTTNIPVKTTPPPTMDSGMSSHSPSPTTSSDSIWNAVSEYLRTPEGLAVVIGGPVIVLLVVIIIVIVCCYCCICRKTKGKYDIGSEKYPNGNLYNGQRVSNTDPQDIQMTLKKVQMERHLITQSAGASFTENEEMDDGLHYQGHSQIQHSQMYSQVLGEGLGTAGSLPKLTPIRPSQIISQVQIGQLSVDDDEENGENVPVKDKHSHIRMPLDDDSPFMHLSDNLSRHSSKSRIMSELNDAPLDQVVSLPGTQHSQFQDTSQMSYLGLGVRHASDVVMTNTASLLEEGDSTGLSTLGLERRSSASHLRHSSASPLLPADNMLDDTPVRDKPATGETSVPRTSGKPTNFALLTSLSSEPDAPVKDTPSGGRGPEEQGSSLGATAANLGKKTMSLGAMTSLPSRLEPQEEKLSASVEVTSEAQRGPERQRSKTLASSNLANFSRSTKNTRLGKLTSLDYIRASLRKRLHTMKSKDSHDKKPLKSALRKTASVSSTSSNESTPNHQPPPGLTYANRHTHYDEFGGRDMSPHPVNYPPHMTSPDMMGTFDVPPVGYMGGAMGYMGGSVPYGGRDPYGYGGPPQLSPGMGYGHELSPILSVPFDCIEPQYRHEIGILPLYGGPISMMGEQFPIPAASQYDDDDLPVLANPYRHGGAMGGPSQGQSQRVTWNLDHEEIPPRTPVDPEELTPSDLDDHEIA